ncbi:37035_t:CDS:2, partial [Racocetra persica]
AIEDSLFLKELLDFANSDELPVHTFPLLYEFAQLRLLGVKQVPLMDKEL